MWRRRRRRRRRRRVFHFFSPIFLKEEKMFCLLVFSVNFSSSFPRRSGGQQDRRLSVKIQTHTIISFSLLLLLLLSSCCNKLNKRRGKRERGQHQKKCGLVHSEKKLPRAERQTRADRPNETNQPKAGGRGMLLVFIPCFSPVSLNYISKTNLSATAIPPSIPFLYTSPSYTTTTLIV